MRITGPEPSSSSDGAKRFRPVQNPDRLFEDEVRRIARQLWPSAQFSGSANVDGAERDGVFETEQCIHLLEATTSRKKQKAADDTRKLARLAVKLQSRSRRRPVQCWFVTRDEPEADQRSVAAKAGCAINVLSFSQFQSRLVDAASYLNVRLNHAFGSIRDPEDGSLEPRVPYVKLDILETESQKLWSVEDIATQMRDGQSFVILGDYGAGKSMTLREVFSRLRTDYFKKETSRFPIYLNLRDHQGQSDPSEILERHARRIGFGNPHHLVRAWKANYVLLLLDGFDEVTGLGIQGMRKKLKESRYRAMKAVREFVRNTPRDSGMVVAGRAHYFDTKRERYNALASADRFLELSLSDFTDLQVQEYLVRSGCPCTVPRWMPTRPLLVGYLASRRMLPTLSEKAPAPEGEDNDPAVGWDALLDRVAAREATIEAGIDGAAVRDILERLATSARESSDGLGGVAPDVVITAFKQVCGYAPDDEAMVLLKRLPGLGASGSVDQSRQFIDADLADACRAGDVVDFALDPFNFDHEVFSGLEYPLDSLGVQVAALLLGRRGCTERKLNAAIDHAKQVGTPPVLQGDLVRISMELDYTVSCDTFVTNILVNEMEIGSTQGDHSRLVFQDCIFGRLSLEPSLTPSRLPRFQGCYVAEVEGRISMADMPKGFFDEECSVESFMTAGGSTDALLNLDLPLGCRVTLTILKKVYLQKGRGRREGALSRGLGHQERRVVPDALRLLRSQGLIVDYRKGETTVWLPVRTQTARVKRLLAAPSGSNDPLLAHAERLD